MDEIKNAPQGAQNNTQGGGRRRRRKRHRGGKGEGANAVAQQQAHQTNQGNQGNQGNQNRQSAQNNQNEQNSKNGQNGQNRQRQQKQKQAPQPQKQAKGEKKQKQALQAPNKNGKQNNKNENRKDTYVYVLDGKLYVNLTNKCSNGCDFCVRNERESYYGYYLWLKNGDPTVEKVISAVNALGDTTSYKEAVFCGFGEPTYKTAEMLELCDFFHSRGMTTRLNTNGQGNLINKRDITPELKDKIDLVNVSLNASCAEKYQPICRSQFGENAFASIVEFAKLCRRNGVNCRFSIVDCIGEEEVEDCKRLAESVKIPLYIRSYITDSGEE